MLQPLSKLNPLALHLEVLQLLALERGEGEPHLWNNSLVRGINCFFFCLHLFLFQIHSSLEIPLRTQRKIQCPFTKLKHQR
jgi:hypothetical protein